MKSFGDILTSSWEEYKKNFGTYLRLFIFLALIPALIMTFQSIPLTNQFKNLGENPTFQEIIPIITSTNGIIIGAIGLIIAILTLLLHTAIYYNVTQNRKLSAKESFKKGSKYFWTYLLFLILISIFLTGLFILLIIPGIIFLVYWIFAGFILFKENKGPIASLKSSYNLVKGRWWSTFGYLILIIIVMILISIIFAIIGGLINILILLPVIISKGFSILINSEIPTNYLILTGIINEIINTTSTLVILPLSILFTKHLYEEYKKTSKNGKNK